MEVESKKEGTSDALHVLVIRTPLFERTAVVSESDLQGDLR